MSLRLSLQAGNGVLVADLGDGAGWHSAKGEAVALSGSAHAGWIDRDASHDT